MSKPPDYEPCSSHAVPEDLTCSSCTDLLCEAVMLPCCAASLCDTCAKVDMEHSGGECPLCGERGLEGDDLIPYRLVRDKVGS